MGSQLEAFGLDRVIIPSTKSNNSKNSTNSNKSIDSANSTNTTKSSNSNHCNTSNDGNTSTKSNSSNIRGLFRASSWQIESYSRQPTWDQLVSDSHRMAWHSDALVSDHVSSSYLGNTGIYCIGII